MTTGQFSLLASKPTGIVQGCAIENTVGSGAGKIVKQGIYMFGSNIVSYSRYCNLRELVEAIKELMLSLL
jgi:hypothetical protein